MAQRGTVRAWSAALTVEVPGRCPGSACVRIQLLHLVRCSPCRARPAARWSGCTQSATRTAANATSEAAAWPAVVPFERRRWPPDSSLWLLWFEMAAWLPFCRVLHSAGGEPSRSPCRALPPSWISAFDTAAPSPLRTVSLASAHPPLCAGRLRAPAHPFCAFLWDCATCLAPWPRVSRAKVSRGESRRRWGEGEASVHPAACLSNPHHTSA